MRIFVLFQVGDVNYLLQFVKFSLKRRLFLRLPFPYEITLTLILTAEEQKDILDLN